MYMRRPGPTTQQDIHTSAVGGPRPTVRCVHHDPLCASLLATHARGRRAEAREVLVRWLIESELPLSDTIVTIRGKVPRDLGNLCRLRKKTRRPGEGRALDGVARGAAAVGRAARNSRSSGSRSSGGSSIIVDSIIGIASGPHNLKGAIVDSPYWALGVDAGTVKLLLGNHQLGWGGKRFVPEQ
jgi:hypothetical protein